MKNILVTGASGNMGKAVIRAFLANGDRVVGTVRAGKSSSFEKEHNYSSVQAELSDNAAGAKLVDTVVRDLGSIDIAVLTAGGFTPGKITGTDTGTISTQLETNFFTVYNIALPIFKQMLQQGHGRIFLFGSKPGLDMQWAKEASAYGLAKSLLFRLAELLNNEAGKKDIVTSVIVPSIIDTPDNRHAMPDGQFDDWIKPQQIADVILSYSDEKMKGIRQPVIKIYNNA